MYEYSEPTWTGLVYPTKAFFPSWVLPEGHIATQTLVEGFKELFNEEPLVDKWTFSTNAVSIMGRYDIPCIGFGPGFEEQAHAPNEITKKDHLVKAAALYATIPNTYLKRYKKA
jgi:putative selenium metabolism hydrolase